MKISSGASQSLQQAQAQADAKNIKNNKMGKGGLNELDSSSPAQVSLSKEAQQILQATEIAKDDSVDESKIAYFQNLIDGGKYQVDSSAVADKLIDEHLKFPT